MSIVVLRPDLLLFFGELTCQTGGGLDPRLSDLLVVGEAPDPIVDDPHPGAVIIPFPDRRIERCHG